MLLLPAAFAAALLTNVTDVTSATARCRLGEEFDVSGMVVTPSAKQLFNFTILVPGVGGTTILDKTGIKKCLTLRPGDIIRTTGEIMYGKNGNVVVAGGKTIDVLGYADPPAPVDVALAELKTGSYDFHPMRTHGSVHEVFRDEIDPQWIYLSLRDGDNQLYTVFLDINGQHDELTRLAGAEVQITGITLPLHSGQRKAIGRTINVYRAEDIAIVTPPGDPFSVPEIGEERLYTPDTLTLMQRRRMVGKVIAARRGGRILVRDDRGEPHKITLSSPDMPIYGLRIEAAGLPETDLYHINLTDAIWRTTPGATEPDDSPVPTSAAALFTNDAGNPRIEPTVHGKAISLTGAIIDLPRIESGQDVLTLKCGEFTVPVDTWSCREVLERLSVGCTIVASGTCIVETGSWHPYSTFPHATGITLALRTPDDIEILSRSPWWTPQRLFVLISSLILALITVIIWNRWLNRLVSRRSRALVKEQLALAEAELKVGERTRLAIELHDSLSQNLAAVACQVAATKSAVKVNADETMENLNTAERMLLSCRTELRRCLWDLRNDALDETNMTNVIRKVLAPVLGQAELQIRFNVARARLDDSTLHSVICIIRELASNAVAHGQATNVTVAGDLDGEILAFSVNENGKGFDPGTCDGPAEGHFGLAGIRERIERLRGTFSLQSHPGKGSYTKITFRLPSNDVED